MNNHLLSTCFRYGTAALILALMPILVCAKEASALMSLHPTSRSPRKELPITAISLTDGLLGERQKVIREKSIPHSWQFMQNEIEDNEVAAGWKKIPRGDSTPWNQANLFKDLETCAYALGQTNDQVLLEKVERILSAVAEGQQPDGYCNATFVSRGWPHWKNLDGSHEGYSAGHLIEAAVAYYEATGRRNFLNVACRLADHIYNHFITEKAEGLCGHAELELALIRLYRVTGEKRYLELARYWIDRRGKPWHYTTETPRAYFMDHLPIGQLNEVTGHAVRSLFYLTGVAGAAGESGDPVLTAAAKRLWDNVTLRKMYVTGGVGSQEKDEGFGPEYDLPDNAYAESCAASGMISYAWEMFLMDGDAKYIDVLERVLYNTMLHGISLDGVTTYYRNPLKDENNPRNNIWVCCPPCITRTLLRAGQFAYADGVKDLYVNLYSAGEARFTVGKNTVTLRQETYYPWDGKIIIRFDSASPFKRSLHLRLPDWARSYAITINDIALPKPKVEKGYAIIDREWRGGDRVVLRLEMPVERIEANPKVANERGRVALQRGPLVYALEGLDNDNNVDRELGAKPEFTVEERDDLLGGVKVINASDKSGAAIMAVPFYALANRTASRQTVWLRSEGTTAAENFPKDALYHPLPLKEKVTMALPERREYAEVPENEITLKADFTKLDGRFRPLHGWNKGPVVAGEMLDIQKDMNALAPPVIRFHDCHWPNPEVVDMHAVFPNPDADPALPESYNFAATDAYVKGALDTGAEIIYRLGESIEHTKVKHYVHKPKDYKRWSEACIGIIRHYTEGWAGGYKYPMRYFEIWNEPENRPVMWDGIDEDYYQLYATASRAIKERFPKLLVGGPAVGGVGETREGRFYPSDFVVKFLDFCKNEKLPLDFFSWHTYTDDHTEYCLRARTFRALLDEKGFAKTESHLTEWNFLPDNKWDDVSRGTTPLKRQTAFERIAGVEGAAFSIASLIALQRESLDKAAYFHGETGMMGLFSEYGVPRPIYHAFALYHNLMISPRKALVTGLAGKQGEAAAGIDDTGTHARVLIACRAVGPQKIKLNVKGLPGVKQATLRTLLPGLSDVPSTEVINASSSGVFTFTLNGPTVALLEVEKE